MTLAEDLVWLRAACRTGVLISWEVVVVLWPVLDRLEEILKEEQKQGKAVGDVAS